MSGGSWDYFYCRLQDIVDELLESDCTYRKALGKEMEKFVTPMQVIEWVDSGDSSFPDDINAIRKCLINLKELK